MLIEFTLKKIKRVYISHKQKNKSYIEKQQRKGHHSLKTLHCK
jgi:hypothetical protein